MFNRYSVALVALAAMGVVASTAEAALVNQWKFDDGSGTHPTALDSVGGKTGTLTNLEAVDWVASTAPVPYRGRPTP